MTSPTQQQATQVRVRNSVDQFYPAIQQPVGDAPGRIWAVGAVHGEIYKLEMLHDALAAKLQDGDKIVYLGNLMGYGYDIVEVLNELLRFRCWFMARPPHVHNDDFVVLRGAQEEMFQKLLQIQFAADPQELLEWMLQHGLETTLLGYGTDAAEAFKAAREGTLGLTYWTTDIRRRMKDQPGHETLITKLKRAATTDNNALLFVSSGIDVTKPLVGQTDALWWASKSFDSIDEPYRDYGKIVRGYDPQQRGFVDTDHTYSIDGGSGRGGVLISACLSFEGELLEILTV